MEADKRQGGEGAAEDERCNRMMEDRAKWMEGGNGSTEPDFVITRETPNQQSKNRFAYNYRTPTNLYNPLV
jgi:hypothetical protein